jgi:DNA-binding transcriptional LysR family regulator
MELSRQAAIKSMVAAGMGVGIVPLSAAREDVERGRLVRWWIEGARINWELGVARLSGGYLSPVCQSFIELCHEYFNAGAKADEPTRQRAKKRAPRAKKRPAAAKRKGGRKK